MLEYKILPFILLANAAVPQIEADAAFKAEIYQSMVQCAAFHELEAERSSGQINVRESQLAVARDFLTAAYRFAAGENPTAKANADVLQTKATFETIIKDGEPKIIAKDWTSLETACRELYPLRAKLLQSDADILTR